MKLVIVAIPDEGQTIVFDRNEEWVRVMVDSVLSSSNPDLDSLSGSILIQRVDKYISINGKFFIKLQVICDRCLLEMSYDFNVPIKMHLSPLYNSERDRDRALKQGEEVELAKDDLEFNFYEGAEIDLSDMIREELVLALPVGFVCNEECKGLCPTCGANQNSSPCDCVNQKPIDPRWSALQGLSLKTDKRKKK